MGDKYKDSDEYYEKCVDKTTMKGRDTYDKTEKFGKEVAGKKI